MNAMVGWALAVVAIAAGWVFYGWRGVLLGLTVVIFWLLLQFTRALRAMRQAGQSPVGRVASAVMFQAKLRPGLSLLQLIQQTRSLGERVGPEGSEPERWRWTDDGGVSVTVELRGGKLSQWTLERPESAAEQGGNAALAPAAAGDQTAAVAPDNESSDRLTSR